jgi:hypothetical protein
LCLASEKTIGEERLFGLGDSVGDRKERMARSSWISGASDFGNRDIRSQFWSVFGSRTVSSGVRIDANDGHPHFCTWLSNGLFRARRSDLQLEQKPFMVDRD